MRCPECNVRNSVAARQCKSCGYKFKRKPVSRKVIIGGAVAVGAICLWAAGAAIIPVLTDPEQNLARQAKQVAAGPKNSDESKRMSDEFDRAIRNYLGKIAGLSTPEILKKLQKVLPSSAFEVHIVDLPRGMRVVEVDTVLQASDYLLMKCGSAHKVFGLSGIEVFDDARLITESASPMLVVIGHAGGPPPHHPQVKVYGLLPDNITDETEKLLPPIRGEGAAKFARNGQDIILDISLLSLGQAEQLFAAGTQSEDSTVHQILEWKEAHYTSRYEYGSSPFTALYAVARCMRYPDLTTAHRKFLGSKGEQLVRENKSQDAGNFKVKRLRATGDRYSYLMTGSVGAFVVDVAKNDGIWSVCAGGSAPSTAAAASGEGSVYTSAAVPVKSGQAATGKAAPVKPETGKPQVPVPVVERTPSTPGKTPATVKVTADEEKQKLEKIKQEKQNARELKQLQREQERLEAERKAAQDRELAERKKEEDLLNRQRIEAARLREKLQKGAAQGEQTGTKPKGASPETKPAQPIAGTEATTAASGQGLVVSSGSVNLRSGPSTGAKPLTSVSKGAPIDIIGKQTGWYKVRFEGKEGYIYAGLVDYKKPDAYTTATVTKNIAGTEGHKKPVGKPQVGDRVVIMGGLENNKYKVQFANGKTGYVDKDAVNVTVDEPQFVP